MNPASWSGTERARIRTDAASGARAGAASFAAAGSYAEQGGGRARRRAVFGNGGHLWISSNGGLWRSTDAATTFERVVAVNAAPAIGFVYLGTAGRGIIVGDPAESP